MISKLRDRLAQHEFLRHVLVLMSGTAVAQLIPMAASIVLARLYTPSEMGIYTLFMSFVQVLIVLSVGRYSVAIVLPEEEADARALVKLSRRVSLWVCLGGGLILLLGSGQISSFLGAPELRFWLPFVGLVAWAYAQVDILGYWCNRHKLYRTMGSNRINQAATTSGLQLALGFLGAGPGGLIGPTFLGQSAGAFTMWRKVRAEINAQPIGSMKAMAVRYKKMPLLNLPTALLDSVRQQGTPVMIAAFFSTAMVGQYGYAWRFLQTPAGLINSSLSQVFYKSLATTPRGAMVGAVRRSVVRSALIGIVPFSLIYFLSPPLFPIVFGDKWVEAGQIGAALAPWLYMNFITSPISTVFLVASRQELPLWYAIPQTIAPFAVLFVFHTNIVSSAWALSSVMAGLLLVYLGMAFLVSRQYDLGHGADRAVDGGAAADDS